ncbi:MAG: glycosyltransferase family 4 protein, partial [Candidatus Omnitrophica bacterium]|nr:glycosyltransferase family 4 protein [Candidatus Omnitrophota bacterium]
MNIWLIQIGEILPLEEKARKMRTALLADKLVERGHNVLWWTSAFNHFKKDWVFKEDTLIDVKEGYKIYALKGIGYKKNISLSRFIDHRIIAWKFKRFAPKMPKPDVIVASMPSHDLAYEAVKYAKSNRIPVIVDVRDEWPDLFFQHIPKTLHPIGRLLLFKDFQMIRTVCIEAISLVSMQNSLLNWSLSKAGRNRSENDKIFYIGAPKVELDHIKPNSRLLYLSEIFKMKNFIVIFIGTFSVYNNPILLVEVAKKLFRENIHFVLAGDGILFNQIQSASKTLPNISLTGWVNEEEIKYILSLSHVGIVPCPLHRAEAFPNKTFTYLSAGLPIISSLQGELKEIIEKYQIGFYYPPNDVDALANCIMKLYNNPELYKKMSENARRVFDVMFDADKIYTEYAEHIERV